MLFLLDKPSKLEYDKVITGSAPGLFLPFLGYFNCMALMDLEKIAQIANVSRSTVSRVVNNQPDVHPEVRQRVQQIIRDTGYQPNTAARSLRNKQSDVLALVICNSVDGLFKDPYFSQLTHGITMSCNEINKTLALFLEGDPETIYPRLTRRGQFDGIILQVGTTDDYLIKKIKLTEIPFIVVGRPVEEGVNFINVDNTSGAYQATLHLIHLKRKRIGSIFCSLNTTTGIDRKAGYCKALHERGIPYREEWVVEGDFTEMGGYRAMTQLLPHHLDAVFAGSDTMARGAIRAIRENGLSVPNDIAIIGFDDLSPALSESPLLTTIRQPITRLGVQSVEILLDMIEHKQHPLQNVVLDVELVVRESSGERLN
jgi:LacI family transcriptional regulator